MMFFTNIGRNCNKCYLPDPPPVIIAVFPFKHAKLFTLPTVNFWNIFKTTKATTGSDKTNNANRTYFKYTE